MVSPDVIDPYMSFRALRFQETVPVTVDLLYSFVVCDRNMVWLNPDQFAVLFMSFIDGQVSLALPALSKKP
jgi:hypothetical protein